MVVGRGEVGDWGGLWRKLHGLSVGSEAVVVRPSSLLTSVSRAATSLQMQPGEPTVGSCDATKTATLAMLPHRLKVVTQLHVRAT